MKEKTNWPVYIENLTEKAKNGGRKVAMRRVGHAIIAIGARVTNSIEKISTYGKKIEQHNGDMGAKS